MGTRRELFSFAFSNRFPKRTVRKKRTDDPNTKKGTKKIPTDVLFPEKVRSGC